MPYLDGEAFLPDDRRVSPSPRELRLASACLKVQMGIQRRASHAHLVAEARHVLVHKGVGVDDAVDEGHQAVQRLLLEGLPADSPRTHDD